MELTALHHVVRGIVRGETKSVSASGVEREALEAWKTKMESVRGLSIVSASVWEGSPTFSSLGLMVEQ